MISASDFLTAFGAEFGNGTKYANTPEDPAYVDAPAGLDYERGTKPMDTLPAQWWNWLNKEYTGKLNEIRSASDNVFNELNNLLNLVEVTPDGTTNEQLKDMFDGLYQDYLAKWLQEDASAWTAVVADHTYALFISDCDATDPDNPSYTMKRVGSIPVALGGTGAANGQEAMDNLTASLATQSPAVGTETVLIKNGSSTRKMSLSDLASALSEYMPSGDSIPAGVVSPYAGSSAPTGWLICDGRALSKATYPELYAAIGTNWGSGDGVNTDFNIPDFREAVPVGTGTRPSGVSNHDVYTLGQFKDDQFQRFRAPVISHNTHASPQQEFAPVFAPPASNKLGYAYHYGNFSGSVNPVKVANPDEVLIIDPLMNGAVYNMYDQGSISYAGPRALDDNGNFTIKPRVGKVTRTKQIGVNYIIKY